MNLINNPHQKFYFILPFFLIALAFVILLTTLVPYYTPPQSNTHTPTPTDEVVVAATATPQPEYSTKKHNSQNLKISLDYPENFKLTESLGKITITNNLKVIYSTATPSQIRVDNFNVSISKHTGSLNSVKQKFYLDDNSTISRGDHIILTGWMGAEGSGEKHYLIKVNDNEWVAVSHQVYADQDIETASKEVDDYLTNFVQEEIVDLILGSIKFENSQNQLGYIKRAYTKLGKNMIDVDYIQWFDDSTAPNGYRIENNNSLIKSFEVDPMAKVLLIDLNGMAGPSIHTGASFEKLIDALNDKTNGNAFFPYEITLGGNKVMEIKARFVP